MSKTTTSRYDVANYGQPPFRFQPTAPPHFPPIHKIQNIGEVRELEPHNKHFVYIGRINAISSHDDIKGHEGCQNMFSTG